MLIDIKDWSMVEDVESHIEEGNMYTIVLGLSDGGVILLGYQDRKKYLKDNTEILSKFEEGTR